MLFFSPRSFFRALTPPYHYLTSRPFVPTVADISRMPNLSCTENVDVPALNCNFENCRSMLRIDIRFPVRACARIQSTLVSALGTICDDDKELQKMTVFYRDVIKVSTINTR